MQNDAREFLTHKCTERCMKRVGNKGCVSNFQCRKTSNLKCSPDHTRHCTVPLANKHDVEVVETLVEIGVTDPVFVNKHGH